VINQLGGFIQRNTRRVGTKGRHRNPYLTRKKKSKKRHSRRALWGRERRRSLRRSINSQDYKSSTKKRKAKSHLEKKGELSWYRGKKEKEAQIMNRDTYGESNGGD